MEKVEETSKSEDQQRSDLDQEQQMLSPTTTSTTTGSHQSISAATSASAKWKKKKPSMSLTSPTTSASTSPLPASTTPKYLMPTSIDKKDASLHKTTKLATKSISGISGLSTPIRSLSETQEDFDILDGSDGWLTFTSNLNLKKSDTLSTAIGQQLSSSPSSKSLQHIATIVDEINDWWADELDLLKDDNELKDY